jgi:spore coat protein U-like protein
MKLKFVQTLVAFALMLTANFAHAAITCNISSLGISAGYPFNSGAQVITQGSYSITCARGLLTDPTTTTYTVKVNNGSQPNGVNNQVAFGANRLKYDLYVNGTCATQWKNPTTLPTIAGTITMTGILPATVTENFWACIPAGQTPPAGTYTDSVLMTPTYSSGVLGGTGTFSITIVTPTACAITASPGNISLSYTAFQAAAASGTTTFGITCGATVTYSMAVNPASGALVGVNYALSLPASATGTGAQQTHTITGTAPANQAGTCATGTCSATQVTTLTITF